MPDENDVQLSKAKLKMLETIRKKADNDDARDTRSSNGYAQSGTAGDYESTGSGSGFIGGIEGGTEGTAETNGTAQGLREGIRPIDRPGIDTVESTRASDRRRAKSVKPVPTTADLDKEEALPKFVLKNPFAKGKPGPVKLFSKSEAEMEEERLTEIYSRGSGLIDDVLEIIVKDHEPVQIWQLSDDEALMLASLHLQRAQKDEAAARSARKLLEIYDKIYFWLIIAPRAKATFDHVQAHKGLGFK